MRPQPIELLSVTSCPKHIIVQFLPPYRASATDSEMDDVSFADSSLNGSLAAPRHSTPTLSLGLGTSSNGSMRIDPSDMFSFDARMAQSKLQAVLEEKAALIIAHQQARNGCASLRFEWV